MGPDQNKARAQRPPAGGGFDPFEHVEPRAELERALARLAVEQPRLAKVVELRRAGQTLRAVGAELGISRERVRQLEVRGHVWLRRYLGLGVPRVKRRLPARRDPSPS
jgi:DNA-directed RNA polymerase sigma subunit (sigma70/sigma32)